MKSALPGKHSQVAHRNFRFRLFPAIEWKDKNDFDGAQVLIAELAQSQNWKFTNR